MPIQTEKNTIPSGMDPNCPASAVASTANAAESANIALMSMPRIPCRRRRAVYGVSNIATVCASAYEKAAATSDSTKLPVTKWKY